MSLVTDIADAVVAEINAADPSTFSQTFTAQRKVVPAPTASTPAAVGQVLLVGFGDEGEAGSMHGADHPLGLAVVAGCFAGRRDT